MAMIEYAASAFDKDPSYTRGASFGSRGLAIPPGLLTAQTGPKTRGAVGVSASPEQNAAQWILGYTRRLEDLFSRAGGQIPHEGLNLATMLLLADKKGRQYYNDGLQFLTEYGRERSIDQDPATHSVCSYRDLKVLHALGIVAYLVTDRGLQGQDIPAVYDKLLAIDEKKLNGFRRGLLRKETGNAEAYTNGRQPAATQAMVFPNAVVVEQASPDGARIGSRYVIAYQSPPPVHKSFSFVDFSNARASIPARSGNGIRKNLPLASIVRELTEIV